MKLIGSILAIYFASSIEFGDTCSLRKYNLISRIKHLKIYRGKTRIQSVFFQGACPNDDEKQKEIENAANFLTDKIFKSTVILHNDGHYISEEAKQKAQTVNSTCSSPYIPRKRKAKYSKIYYCQIDVRDLCYAFAAKFCSDAK